MAQFNGVAHLQSGSTLDGGIVYGAIDDANGVLSIGTVAGAVGPPATGTTGVTMGQAVAAWPMNMNGGAILIRCVGAGTIGIGDNVANTTTIGNTTAATAVAINGGTGAAAVRIRGGAAGTIAIADDAVAYGAVNIGTGGATIPVTIGSVTAGTTVAINGGTGASAVLIRTGAAGTVGIADNALAHTINIGNGAAVQTMTIGSTNTTSQLLLQGGTNNLVLTCGGLGGGVFVGSGVNAGTGDTVSIGNTAATHTINIATDATTTQTIIIGSSFGASNVTIRGGTGAAFTADTAAGGTIAIGATSNTLNIGNITAATAVAINGGTGAAAVLIRTGAAGIVGIADNNVANTINIGSTAGSVKTIALGNATAGSTIAFNGGTAVRGITFGRVTGATGAGVGLGGQVATARTGAGVYTLTFSGGMTYAGAQTKFVVTVSLEDSAGGAAAPFFNIAHTSDTVVTVNTFTNAGVAADHDFAFSVYLT